MYPSLASASLGPITGLRSPARRTSPAQVYVLRPSEEVAERGILGNTALSFTVAIAAVTRDREAGGLGPVLVVDDDVLLRDLVLSRG
jgi:hypothetical protein